MADSTSANGAPAGGRPGGWTDTERFQLVLRVLATLLTEGKSVEWKSVNMPNRTLKAMQGQWTSILAQMRDLNTDGGDAPAPKAKTPLKKPAAAKKKKAAAAKNSENANEDSGDHHDDGETKKAATPKKRAAATDADGTPKKRRTPAKKTAPKTEPVSDEAGTEADVPKEENSDEQ
ncbi:uncharacterized protein GLRG_02878 [Colletotrichum graminicola M1.001]|uniref:Myb-like domain-containing protein n=1 Tax=Colletotrichum graminicola (strain M1.001 / M2 / FGSC 10212) TaxID=645133 RepID=E3QA46_COLGM|nr:uncharacterized protein GLRG_02878 [Colletotrichum graminicola M1.001]EFQ27734.1 hypothetical protein GLRG_02878 [Colletotrichum graminicola M1.001]